MGNAVNEILQEEYFFSNPYNRIVKFHFYEGISPESELIKWQTHSIYSHVSCEICNVVYESWIGSGADGVVKSNDKLAFHTKGTKITTIEVQMDNIRKWRNFLESQVGKKYDKKAIFGFAINKDLNNRDEWICSELQETFFVYELTEYKVERMLSPQNIYSMLKVFKAQQRKYKELIK